MLVFVSCMFKYFIINNQGINSKIQDTRKGIKVETVTNETRY